MFRNIQTSPLTVTPVTVTQYSYNDIFPPKKVSSYTKNDVVSDTPLILTILAVPEGVTVSGDMCTRFQGILAEI